MDGYLLITGLLASLLGQPASPPPAYLSCVIHDAGKDLNVNITTEEKNQAATLEIPSTGYIERDVATFSPTRVTFATPLTHGSIIYMISRTDLSIERSTSATDVASARGTCQVQPEPKRVF